MSKTRICKNKDNNYLMPLRGRGFLIGAVDEVNGRGAKEVPDFVPTRHELLQLLNFWVKEALDYEYFEFLYAQTGSTELRLIPYAWRRVNRIGELLGEERAKKAVEKAYAEFGKNKNQRDWEIFMHGSSEDSKALQDEIHREMEDYFRSREKGECPENE